MDDKHKQVLDLAAPYLKKGLKKDLLLHTQAVVKAMELLLVEIEADADILIPAAILHDVGWSEVPENLQMSSVRDERKEALRLHIDLAGPVIQKIVHIQGSRIRRLACGILHSYYSGDQEDIMARSRYRARNQ